MNIIFQQRERLTVGIMVLVLAIIAGTIFFLNYQKGTFAPEAATINATMSLEPSSKTTTVGQEFNIAIKVDTGGQLSDSAEALISYDPTYLEVSSGTKITAGTFYLNTMTNQVSNGKITYIATTDLTSAKPVSGTGTLATIKFKAKKAVNNTKVSFIFTQGSTLSTSSGVSNHPTGDNPVQNILGSVVNANYVLSNSSPSKSDDGESAEPAPTDDTENSNESAEDTDVVAEENQEQSSTDEPTEELTEESIPTTSDTNSAPTALSSELTPTDPDQISFLPTNIAPKTISSTKTVELYQNETMKPWALWFLYAIIPAFLSGTFIYIYLKKRQEKTS